MSPKPKQLKNWTSTIVAKAICHNTAFTLIEILIVLSILSISVGSAIYYFLPNIAATKSNLLADDLLHHLHYARSEAIKRNQIVGICGTQDAQTCSSNWNKGYLIYTKPSSQSAHQEIIKVNHYPDTHANISSLFSIYAEHIQFTPCGRSQNNGKIIVQSNPSMPAHIIFISLTGRIRRA